MQVGTGKASTLKAMKLFSNKMKRRNSLNPKNSYIGKSVFTYIILIIELCFVLIFVCSCNKPKQTVKPETVEFFKKANVALTNELAQETGEAVKSIYQMLEQGLLPGVKKGEHGSVISDGTHLMTLNKVIEVTYPLFQTYRLVKTGETSTNNYILERTSKDAAWHLIKAWETDSNGKTINEWPIK